MIFRLMGSSRRCLGRHISLFIGLCSAFVFLVGCGDGRPTRVPISGQVLIDGEPLARGTVKLVPTGARPSSGKIGPDGRFVLSCYEGEDGAIPGTHRVAVAANEALGDTAMKWYAPKKYADFRNSGLTVTIDEENPDLKIELTWDGGKPYIEGRKGGGGDSTEGD